MQTKLCDAQTTADSPATEPMAVRFIFEGPTSFLNRLHAHFTVLQPGAGYPSHSDEHEVAILLFAGRIKTNGVIHEAPASIYFPAGVPHDMGNVGEQQARYLVFEFHCKNTDPAVAGH
jgi:hypothetical protein